MWSAGAIAAPAAAFVAANRTYRCALRVLCGRRHHGSSRLRVPLDAARLAGIRHARCRAAAQTGRPRRSDAITYLFNLRLPLPVRALQARAPSTTADRRDCRPAVEPGIRTRRSTRIACTGKARAPSASAAIACAMRTADGHANRSHDRWQRRHLLVGLPHPPGTAHSGHRSLF